MVVPLLILIRLHSRQPRILFQRVVFGLMEAKTDLTGATFQPQTGTPMEQRYPVFSLLIIMIIRHFSQAPGGQLNQLVERSILMADMTEISGTIARNRNALKWNHHGR